MTKPVPRRKVRRHKFKRGPPDGWHAQLTEAEIAKAKLLTSRPPEDIFLSFTTTVLAKCPVCLEKGMTVVRTARFKDGTEQGDLACQRCRDCFGEQAMRPYRVFAAKHGIISDTLKEHRENLLPFVKLFVSAQKRSALKKALAEQEAARFGPKPPLEETMDKSGWGKVVHLDYERSNRFLPHLAHRPPPYPEGWLGRLKRACRRVWSRITR